MLCRMQSVGLFTHDKLLTSSIYTKAGVNLGMPAVTVQSQAFDDTLMQDTALMKKVPLKDEFNTQCDVHAQYVLQLLQLQRKAGFLCDITIHVKDRSFKAHKPLLAACSLYFRSLFADSDSKESTALNLVPLTPTGFEILLDYIYSGDLAITPDNCSAVLSAAICLQMTNVVETCKKFMQSTFQMNGNQDLMKLHVDNPTGDEIHHNLLKNSKNAKAPVHYLQNNSVGSHLITEEESHVSLVKSFSRGQSVDCEQDGGGKYSLPNATQLQSVLPILMSNHPRQPTPVEVQSILASFPNAAEIIARYRLLNPSAAKKHSNSNNSNQKQQGQNQEVYSCALLAQTSPHLLKQNDHASTLSRPLLNSASIVQDISTLYPAAQPLKTAEHGSGFAPTTNKLANHKHGRRRHHERKNIPMRSTSREPNSIEISSDDDGGSSVWSAERSGQLIPDLSGTPCATASHSAMSPPFNLTHSKLASPDTEEDCKAPVSKALSLPSLSGSPTVQPLSRARSAEQCDGKSWLDLKFFKKSGSSDGNNHIEGEENKDSGSVSEQASDILSPSNEGMAEIEATRSIGDNGEERNFVLDLSVAGNQDSKEKAKVYLDTRASVSSRRPECDSQNKEISRRLSITSSFSDPGMRIAADALSMLKQSKAKGSDSPSFDYQIHSVASDSGANESKDNQIGGSVWDDDVTNFGAGGDQSSLGAAKQAAFSRKPRRTTGGQTCTWPGCKRLFRHRNIYEEHQRMHERGVPGT